MNQAPLFESLKNTVSDKTDFCALLQPNLQEAPPTPAPSPPISKQPLPFLRPDLQHIPYFHHSFPGHALPIISHLAATGAIPIYSANERKRFTPSPFSTRKGVSPPPLHPSSVSSPAEFLTSKPAQPPKDCAGSFFSLFMLPLRFLFLPSVSKKSPEEGSPPASLPLRRPSRSPL